MTKTAAAAGGRRALFAALAAALAAALLWWFWAGGKARAPGDDAIVVVPGAPAAPLRPAASTGGSSLGGIVGAVATPGRRFAEALALAPRAGGGWLLTEESDAALLRRHNLRAGDVLLDMDGAPLDPARIRALGDELAPADAIEVGYERDGQLRKRLLTFDD